MKIIEVPTEYNGSVRLEVDEKRNGLRIRVEGFATPLIHKHDAEELLKALTEEVDPKDYIVKVDGKWFAGEPGKGVEYQGNARRFSYKEALAYVNDARLWLEYRDGENATSFAIMGLPR